MAVIVGVLAAGGAIGLRWLIAGAQWFFFDGGASLMETIGLHGSLGRIHLLLVPAVGMVIVSAIVRRFAPEAGGHGVPEVQYAVRMRGGKIRPRVALVKAVASGISIGSGGSVGREGPIVQIGSALGSTVGQIAGLGSERIKVLVAAGAAAAIGATFNAPIAGVMFAVEVILISLGARSLSLVVIASVSATALSQAVLGREPAFRLIQQFTLVNEGEFLFYLLLGVVIGVLATLYIRSVYWFESSFERWQTGPTVKALVGGLAVGALGYFGSTHIFGVGHEGVELALSGDLAIRLMLLLVLLKMLATSITLGARGSGGVFAPALFIGAMAGGAFGAIVHNAFPTWTAPSGAYALVGMAALFGAAAHAPITAIVVLFEMTDDYQIILPLMFTVVLSYLIAGRLFQDSIYSFKLRRRGALAGVSSETSVLDFVLVADAMSEEFETVGPELSLRELAEKAHTSRTRSWPVVDSDEKVLGIVTETDLAKGALEAEPDTVRVEDVMTKAVITCVSHDTLRRAFRRFAELDVQLIPVVDEEEHDQLIGVLRRHEMSWAYKELSEEHQRLLSKASSTGVRVSERAVQREFQVPSEGSSIADKRLRDLRLPENVLVVFVRRGHRAFVPRGDTKLEPGDVLTLMTTGKGKHELEELIERWS